MHGDVKLVLILRGKPGSYRVFDLARGPTTRLDAAHQGQGDGAVGRHHDLAIEPRLLPNRIWTTSPG
jgi:hypothetical protein